MPNPSILRPDFVASPRRVRVVLGGEVIAQSEATVLVRGARTIPIYYFPQTDVNTEFLKPSGRVEAVDTKRDATYWNVAAGGKSAENAAWSFTTSSSNHWSICANATYFFMIFASGVGCLSMPGILTTGSMWWTAGGQFGWLRAARIWPQARRPGSCSRPDCRCVTTSRGMMCEWT